MSRSATAGAGPQPRHEQPVPLSGALSMWGRRRREHAELRSAVVERGTLAALWRGACEGVELCHRVRVPAGLTISTPTVAGTVAGDPIGLIVRLLPGQLPRDVQDKASRLAPALGAARLRVTARGDQHVRVDLLADDPLERFLMLPPVNAATAATPRFVGVSEAGVELASAWTARPHTICAGTTGSGKSTWLYGQLSDAAACPDIIVGGIDPSGLIFRPFTGTRHADWQCSGLSVDLAVHEKLLRSLVDEMDRRTTTLPADVDNMSATIADPLLVVLLEDYAGLLTHADGVDRRLGQRLRGLICRLLAEGRKAEVRVVIVVQRGEAAVVGAFERSNAALRITFGADSPETIRLLHPAVRDPEDHVHAPPGIGLLTAPGWPLVRFRAGLVGGYAAYCARVHAATRGITS